MSEIPGSETLASTVPLDAQDGRRLWRFTLDAYRTRRRPTREVRVGDVGIGGTNPVRVQSMTVADTLDTPAVVAEIEALARAGCEIVRVTAPNRSSAENLAAIVRGLRRRGVRVPLVADIHFTPQAALLAALHVEKVRVNPGNYADRKHFQKREYSDAEYAEELERLETAFRPLVLRCKERGVAMRIGTNHGSLSDRITNRYGDTPLGMVESALEFVRICEHHGYRDLVLSMKASDVKVMVQAYRLLAARMRELGMDYPFHLGVTEAGAGFTARVKSTIGMAALLADGIGDTVRVSLTEDSVHEIPVARALAALVSAAAAAPAAAALQDVPPPPWNPYVFQRRACGAALGVGSSRLSQDHPPRIEIVVALPPGVESALAAARAARAAARGDDGADLVLLSLPPAQDDAETQALLGALAPWAALQDTGPALGIELHRIAAAERVPAALLAPWARLAVRLEPAELDLQRTWTAPVPVQYVLAAADPERAAEAAPKLAAHIAAGRWPRGAVCLEAGEAGVFSVPHALRRLLALWPAGASPPVVLRGPRRPNSEPIDAHLTAGELHAAAALGSLLVDGIGDAVQLEALPDVTGALRLGREVLQATRLRIHKADFIACPSCGRTQFDLQTTTAAIEARLRHLRGLKIAVMGCIVNGPGEMADADFGYVGSGPGKIDLYVGRERLERSVPEAEAVDRLIALIQSRGLWVNPGTSPPAPV